jgi:hypothetical protein
VTLIEGLELAEMLSESQLKEVPDMLQLVPPSPGAGTVPVEQPSVWSTTTAGAE